MRLPPTLRQRLDREFGQLRHMTRAERSIWATVRQNGTAKRADVRALVAEFESPGITGSYTPAEAELVRLVIGSDQR